MLSRLISSETHKPNLVINDTDGRLLAHLYRPLKQNGYQIKVLNLMDMDHSIPYNPLAIVESDIKDGNVNKASADCDALSGEIYDPSEEGQNAFFYTIAASFFNALVFSQFASIHYNKIHHIKGGLTTVTIRSVIDMVLQLEQKGGMSNPSTDDEAFTTELIVFFKNLHSYLSKLKKNPHADKTELSLLQIAVSNYEECHLAGDKTTGSMYSTFIDRLQVYQQPSVAKLTSRNQIDFQSFGFNRLAFLQYAPSLSGCPVSVRIFTGNTLNLSERPIEFFKTQSSISGLVKIPLTSKLKNYDRFYIRSTIHDDQKDISLTSTIQCDKHYYTPTDYLLIKHNADNNPNTYLKRSLISNLELSKDRRLVLDKYNKKFVIHNIDTKLIKNNQHLIKKCHVLYKPQPIALFCVTPPNENELNGIVTSLIYQIYSALQGNQIKLQQPLDFIIDDADCIPKIHNLRAILSKSSSSKRINMIYVAQNIDWLKHIYGSVYTKQLLSSCAISEQISDGAIEPRVILCSNFKVFLQAMHLVMMCKKHHVQSLQSIPVYSPQKYDHILSNRIYNEIQRIYELSCTLIATK